MEDGKKLSFFLKFSGSPFCVPISREGLGKRESEGRWYKLQYLRPKNWIFLIFRVSFPCSDLQRHPAAARGWAPPRPQEQVVEGDERRRKMWCKNFFLMGCLFFLKIVEMLIFRNGMLTMGIFTNCICQDILFIFVRKPFLNDQTRGLTFHAS